MASLKLRNGRVVGDYENPYVVAELNTSHFGDLDKARDMLDVAKSVGCDCVKFQSWTSETLYSAAYYRTNKIAKRMVDKFSLDEATLSALASYASELEIDFASTPYSKDEAAFLVEKCNVPYIKIASMELNNLPFLAFLGELQVPLVLSTGMGTEDEIHRAVETITATGNRQLIILHCTSLYPTDPQDIRLLNIEGLRAAFPDFPIGYSDHSIGPEIPTAAVALGACLLEKHFTLDNSVVGMDNQMATTPDVMETVVKACREVNLSLGGRERIVSEREIEQAKKMRRSLVAARELPAGHTLSADDVIAKRPGGGIPASELQRLVGKTLKTDIGLEEMILHEHLES